MTIAARHLRIGCLMTSVLFLPGCAGLFNQPRLDKAKEAQSAFLDAKLSESLDQERTHTAALHARELSVTERQGIAIRDAELLQIIDKNPAEGHKILSRRIRDRLDELGGTGARAIASKLDAIAKQEQALDGRADAYRNSKTPDDPAPRCPKDAQDANKLSQTKFSSKAAEADWKDLQAECEALAKLRQELEAQNAAGEYAEVLRALRTFDEERARIKAKVTEADEAFKAAKKTLEAQRAANKPVDLKIVAEGLKKQLDGIAVPDAQSLGLVGIDRLHAEAELKWLETQQTHIANLLAAAAASDGSVDVPQGIDDDLQIARVLPGIAAQLDAGLRYPRLSALILQSEHLRLEADRLRNEIARTDQHIELLRSRRKLMNAETHYLSEARNKLTKCKDRDLAAETFAKLPDECRNAFTSALIAYANAWTLGRIPASKIDWAVVQLHHDMSLDQSVSALAQWQNLIGVPLAALVKSYETGVKAEDIGRTLNAAGLGWIGLGVH